MTFPILAEASRRMPGLDSGLGINIHPSRGPNLVGRLERVLQDERAQYGRR